MDTCKKCRATICDEHSHINIVDAPRRHRSPRSVGDIVVGIMMNVVSPTSTKEVLCKQCQEARVQGHKNSECTWVIVV